MFGPVRMAAQKLSCWIVSLNLQLSKKLFQSTGKIILYVVTGDSMEVFVYSVYWVRLL